MNRIEKDLFYLDDPMLPSYEVYEILVATISVSVFEKALNHPNLELDDLCNSIENSFNHEFIQDQYYYLQYPKLPKYLKDYIKIRLYQFCYE